MGININGQNPFSYMGVIATDPPQMIPSNRRPTANDANFRIGTLWIVTKQASPPSEELWFLTDVALGIADWVEAGSTGTVVPGNNFTILTANGSGGFGTNINPGTLGQIFVGQGASANPSFITPTAGEGLTLTSDGTTFEYAIDFPVTVDDGGTGLVSLDKYKLLAGDNVAPIHLIAPGATSGIALVSQGASAYPAYDTVAVAGGGTGVATWTTNQPVIGGTTATGALEQVPAGTAGQYLQSNGASAPSWVNPPLGAMSLKITEYTTGSGNHTIDADCVAVNVIVVGAGAAGFSGNAVIFQSAGGSPGSLYISNLIDVDEIGGASAVIAYSLGAGGVGNGANGGNTSFGSFGAMGGQNIDTPFRIRAGVASGGSFSSSPVKTFGSVSISGSSVWVNYRKVSGISMLNPNPLMDNVGEVGEAPISFGTGAPTMGGFGSFGGSPPTTGGAIKNGGGQVLLAGGTAATSIAASGNGNTHLKAWGVWGGTGGGGGRNTGSFTSGANGGYPGGGGGGGGSGTSGAGGHGGNGYIRVIEYISS